MNEQINLYCKNLPVPKAWDQTMLTMLQDCPYKFHLFMQGYVKDVVGEVFGYGIALHAGLQEHVEARYRGDKDPVEAALTKALDAYKNVPVKVKTIRQPMKLALNIVGYTEHYRNVDDKIVLLNEKPAVEVSFKIPLDGVKNPDGEEYLLCGHIDRLAHINNKTVILEYKHTGESISDWYYKQFWPSNQNACYLFAARKMFQFPVHSVLMDVSSIKYWDITYHRKELFLTNDQLNEWEQTIISTIKEAERYAESNHWPKRYASCKKRYSLCQYHDICSNCDAMRDAQLNATIWSKQSWNPLISRERLSDEETNETE